MKESTKSEARILRKKGMSIKSIAKELGSPQSSISNWVRDIPLTEKQKQKLIDNMHSPEAVEKRRKTRLQSEKRKRSFIFDNAYTEIDDISDRELWLIGVSLYWAEGGKTQRMVRFSNGDPRMIKIMIRFFEKICGVKKSSMRAHIHIHESLNIHAAEKYWQGVTGIESDKFYKTYNKPNKSSKGTRNSLPNGVCDIYCGDYKLFIKIEGWTEAIYNQSLK